MAPGQHQWARPGCRKQLTQGGGVSVTKPGGWRRSPEGRAQRAEGVEHSPTAAGPSAEHRAHDALQEGVQAQRRQSGLPRVTRAGRQLRRGLQTPQGPPEGCSFGHTAPPSSEDMLLPQPLALRPMHRRHPAGTRCLHPQHHLPPTSPSTEDGWRPLPGLRPKHPQVASHVTGFTAAHVRRTEAHRSKWVLQQLISKGTRSRCSACGWRCSRCLPRHAPPPGRPPSETTAQPPTPRHGPAVTTLTRHH